MAELDGNYSHWDNAGKVQRYLAGNMDGLSEKEAETLDFNGDGKVDNKDYLFAQQDANMDGIIDQNDVNILSTQMEKLQNYLDDKNLFSKEEALSTLDINNSGKVNSSDLKVLKDIIDGIDIKKDITEETNNAPIEEEEKCPSENNDNVTAEDIQKYVADLTNISNKDAVKKYDINGDEKVTIQDATALQRKESEESNNQSDSKLSVKDATKLEKDAEEIQKYIAEIIKKDESEALEEYDINGDGKVTIQDATALQRKESEESNNQSDSKLSVKDATKLEKDAQEIQKYIAGIINKGESEALEEYDINGDGKVTIQDATALQRQALEIQKKIADY